MTKTASSKYATNADRIALFVPCAMMNPNAKTPEKPTKDDSKLGLPKKPITGLY